MPGTQTGLTDSESRTIADLTQVKYPSVSLNLLGVSIQAALVDNHICGGMTKGAFKCDIHIEVDKLDNNGFVTDNQTFIDTIKREFRGRGLMKASCEELCNAIVNFSYHMVGDNTKTIRARIYNLTGHVDITWKRGMVVPNWPRKATSDEADRTTAGRGRRESSC